MQHKSHTRILNLTFAGVSLALCLVLPFLTGQIRQIGNALSPMHIPVFLAGYLCGPWWAGAVGLFAPLLRHLLFGMPPVPSCYAMAFELATYGIVTGALYRALPKKTVNIYVTLLTSMLAGRIVSGIAMKLLMTASGKGYTFAAFLAANFVKAVPGIILHIVLVPVLVLALRRAGIIPAAHSHAHTDGHSDMKTEDIRAFFDACAPSWDAEMIRDDRIISEILDAAGVREGADVLDVACGTGVLFPDYLARNVESLTGIDLSPEMVKIAREKYPDVPVLCGDILETPFDRSFDAIIVYNAFPHFPDADALFRRLAENLKPGGRLTIAHGMSREALNAHHSGSASKVSLYLEPAKEVAARMGRVLHVDTVISDDEKYIVSSYK